MRRKKEWHLKLAQNSQYMQGILLKIKYFERGLSKEDYQLIHGIINYSTFVCPFESGKWKERETMTKNWSAQQRKELFRLNKKHFS